MAAIIELQRISKHYSKTIIGVDDVSLDVEDGEFVTLLGPSGCGKSTLLRMIGGFEAPTHGMIRLAGQDVTHVPPYRRDVNMVFQDYALFPHMTVGENIAYGLKIQGRSRAQARDMAVDALALVGLPDKIDQKPAQLSGGQRQRVALARAIVRRPKVLLLDEPLSALDARLRDQMRIEMKHLHEKVGITFIMVTHDQEEALTMSDRVVVMEKGRVAQDGRPQDLYDQPASPYVANFIGTTNFVAGSLTGRSPAGTRIASAAGDFTATADLALPQGAEVTLGFRPEKVRLLAEGETAANVVPGRIAEVIYYGLGLRTTVELAGGTQVHVDCLLPDSLARSAVPQPGAPVRLGIEPHNVFVFAGRVAA
ncbi:putative spermidine/putrescine transport system ATP-binding protein [Gemmobacter aquatilis]|uniref:Spermidine/putrescine import ATP-binding protein PotA n=1 Tax=Gemmobacter aquatilis TaxID=933059 RepID=A0A1H8A1X3_9RHOB|nr:ABC transporter ATP-binding protein [Gemmobacter aquatilis]SEM64591.1 putative spermidine/putrescine transport system ATP-binding protein [Gemmobacter aquatilis]